MLGRKQEINLQLTELLDSALLAFSLWFAHFLRSQVAPRFIADLEAIPDFSAFFWVLAVVAPFTPIVLEARGFYNNIVNKHPARSLRQLAGALVWMGMIVGATMVFFRWQIPSRSVVVLAVSLAFVFLLLREAWQRELIRRWLSSASNREPVLLAGCDQDIDQILEEIAADSMAEIEVVGRIDITRLPVEELVKAMHEKAASRVIFAAQHVHFGRIEEAVQACETEGVEAWIAADFFQTALARPTFDVMSGKLMLVFHCTPRVSWSMWFKEIFDRLGALVLILLTSPIWLAAILGIRLSSPGPVFFRQERSGRYGKPFMMWKFRSMHANAEEKLAELAAANEMSGPVFKLRKDPRVFRFGAWMRRLSVDELPQLINVLRGEMSLVGPRPLPVYEIQKIEKRAQRRRLSVKPGLTCLWQVSGRNGITNFEEWVALDLQYIDNWSLWLDLQILFRTVPAVVRGAGAH